MQLTLGSLGGDYKELANTPGSSARPDDTTVLYL